MVCARVTTCARATTDTKAQHALSESLVCGFLILFVICATLALMGLFADLSIAQGIKVTYRLRSAMLTINELVAICTTDLERFNAQLAEQLEISMSQLVLAEINVRDDGVYFKLSILVSGALTTLKNKIMSNSISILYGPNIVVADGTSFDLSTCENNCAMTVGACVSAHGCQTCNAGYTPNAQTGDCDVCGAGHYATGTMCAACAANTFDHDLSSATACIACGINTFSAAGSTTCSPCPFGTHRDVNSDSCQPCLNFFVCVFAGWVTDDFCLCSDSCLGIECLHGVCTGPNICTCNNGYQGAACSERIPGLCFFVCLFSRRIISCCGFDWMVMCADFCLVSSRFVSYRLRQG